MVKAILSFRFVLRSFGGPELIKKTKVRKKSPVPRCKSNGFFEILFALLEFTLVRQGRTKTPRNFGFVWRKQPSLVESLHRHPPVGFREECKTSADGIIGGFVSTSEGPDHVIDKFIIDEDHLGCLLNTSILRDFI